MENMTDRYGFDICCRQLIPHYPPLHFRPHRIQWQRPVATDVARGVVCLSVCVLGDKGELCKNRSRCRLGAEWCGHRAKEPCIRWESKFPVEKGNVGGCPSHWKSLGVSAAVYAANGIIQSSITASLPTAVLPTGRWHIILPPVKNSSLRCGLSSEFFDHWLTFPCTTNFHFQSSLLADTASVLQKWTLCVTWTTDSVR